MISLQAALSFSGDFLKFIFFQCPRELPATISRSYQAGGDLGSNVNSSPARAAELFSSTPQLKLEQSLWLEPRKSV
jgi:hypothetical protein